MLKKILIIISVICLGACSSPDSALMMKEKAERDSLRNDSLDKEFAKKIAEADSICKNKIK